MIGLRFLSTFGFFYMSCWFFVIVFFEKNYESDYEIREKSGFIISELVVGYGEQKKKYR